MAGANVPSPFTSPIFSGADEPVARLNRFVGNLVGAVRKSQVEREMYYIQAPPERVATAGGHYLALTPRAILNSVTGYETPKLNVRRVSGFRSLSPN